jgi:hypothetical protein
MITLLGWVGALLALAAYSQTRAARFRQIALLSSVALLTFNVLLGIWSNVVLESALGIVNVGRLVQLRQPRTRSADRRVGHLGCSEAEEEDPREAGCLEAATGVV